MTYIPLDVHGAAYKALKVKELTADVYIGADESDSSYAFRWGHRVPGLIGAVVIDHVVCAHPMVARSLHRAELLVGCGLPPVVSAGRTTGGPRHLAALEVEILVVGVEWGFAPIYLLEAAPRRPVVGLP